MALSYFHLNKLAKAVDMITSAVKLNANSAKAVFWKGLIYFYYIYSKRQINADQKPLSAQKQADTLKVMTDIINICE